MVGMVLALGADVTGADAQKANGNIEQRVFDKFPAFPAVIALTKLYDVLPYVDRRSIQNALARMLRDGAIARVEDRMYRIAATCTRRPNDARGRRGA